jgi:sRNA-binding regulator protein Hfq
MRTADFLDGLRAKKIVVFLENGKVKVDAEQHHLTDNFLSELKARKAEILEYLTEAENLKKPQILDLATIEQINAKWKAEDDANRRNIYLHKWSDAIL